MLLAISCVLLIVAICALLPALLVREFAKSDTGDATGPGGHIVAIVASNVSTVLLIVAVWAIWTPRSRWVRAQPWRKLFGV